MLWCPACRNRYPNGTTKCPKDGSALSTSEIFASPDAGQMGTVVTAASASPSAIPKTLVRMPQSDGKAGASKAEVERKTQPDERSRPEITLREMVMDLQAGHKVGEYVVERRLGEGGMAVVYAGIHPLIGKKVAIKLLAPALAADQDMVRRFVGEARAVNQIGHRNIVDIFGFGQLPDGRHYFVMELLEGESLAERLLRIDPPLSPEEVLEICLQITSAIGAAHQRGIVHRDLKPENLFLVASDGNPYVKVLDFGIAKLLGSGPELSKTATGMPMGTPTYMSPEQTAGRGVDHRTDIYALGVILFQMVAGRPPFESENYVEVLHAHLTQPPPPLMQFADVASGFESLVQRMLSKRPEDRPASMEEVRQMLIALGQQSERTKRPLFVRHDSSSGGPGAGSTESEEPQGELARAEEQSAARSWRRTVALGGLAFVGILVALAVPRMQTKTTELPGKTSPMSRTASTAPPVAPRAAVPTAPASATKTVDIGTSGTVDAKPTAARASLTIHVEPPEALSTLVLQVNDAPSKSDESLALSPGAYKIVARANGFATTSEEVVLGSAEKRQLQLILTRARRRKEDKAAASSAVMAKPKPKGKVETPAQPLDRNATLKPDFGP